MGSSPPIGVGHLSSGLSLKLTVLQDYPSSPVQGLPSIKKRQSKAPGQRLRCCLGFGLTNWQYRSADVIYAAGRVKVSVVGKGGYRRELPVPARLARVLLHRVWAEAPSLWPGDRSACLQGVERARLWQRSTVIAGLPRIQIHQLRHTRLTRWAVEKKPWEFSALSGQKDLHSSRYYVLAAGVTYGRLF